MLVNSKNQFVILFVNDHYYSKGILLQFSGLNGSRFYFLAKQNIIDWKIFQKFKIKKSRKSLQDIHKKQNQIILFKNSGLLYQTIFTDIPIY